MHHPDRSRYLIAAVLLVVLIGLSVGDVEQGHFGRLVVSGVLTVGVIVAVVTLPILSGCG